MMRSNRYFWLFAAAYAIACLLVECMLITRSQVAYASDLIAHYPLRVDANDATGNQGPMYLVNTPFQEEGIYCNGIYMGNPDYCDAITPDLEGFSFEGFSISAEFKVHEYPEVPFPVFMGGRNYRWAGFFIWNDRTVALKYNGSNYRPSGIQYSTDTWYTATLTYNAGTETAKIYLDSTLAYTQIFEIVHGDDRDVGISDRGTGLIFKGTFRELKIYNSTIDPSCHVTVTGPDGGESWCAGEGNFITWTTIGSHDPVSIVYSIDTGVHWLPVVEDTPDDGSYFWTVPNTPGVNCLVKIQSGSGSGCFDISDTIFKISGCGPLDVVTDSLPEAYKDVPYEYSLTASGGILPYSWSVISGALPPGLDLNSNTGVISGIPDSLGTFCCTIQVEDDDGTMENAELCMTVSEFTGLIGDVNSDGLINVLDVLGVVNHILGLQYLGPEALFRADCNGDKVVNILDALGVVNVILGIGECGP